jgi:glutathione S-transferase
MSSSPKPLKLWGTLEPNVQKVEMFLRVLDLSFERVPVSFLDVKTAAYLAINPNGRLPALQDPNTGILLWETGAIIEYLVENYDGSGKISFTPGSQETYLAKQWLFFQTSGQGPCKYLSLTQLRWCAPSIDRE